MKLLLHTCCGPCFLGVWEDLSQKDIEVTSYFYNPNIQPGEEYEKRLETLQKVTASKQVDLIVGEYKPERHIEAIAPFVIPAKAGIQENQGKDGSLGLRPGMTAKSRCRECYRLRLDETARKARAENYDSFSTTLLVSPYQQHDWLREVGEDMAEKHGVEFYYTDWRPYFREGQNEAKEQGIYRQKYCGCAHSLEETKSSVIPAKAGI